MSDNVIAVTSGDPAPSEPSMSEMTSISEKQLNEIVIAQLREHRACTDARSVMLERVRDPGQSHNWQIGHFDPGIGDRYACKIALRRIHEKLRETYAMVGES